MSCQPTESFEFEIDIFVSAGVVNTITEDNTKKGCRISRYAASCTDVNSFAAL